MQSLDAHLHVDPFGVFRGLLMIFNPTSDMIQDELEISLYYTGISTEVAILQNGEKDKAILYTLSRDYKVTISVMLNPKSYAWFLIL